MSSGKSFVCKLGGFSDSNPEMVTMFPEFNLSTKKLKEILFYCLPEGCQDNEFKITKYQNTNILSYVFRNPQKEDRDDLISYSLLLEKKENPEVYKEYLKVIFGKLRKHNMLNEEILLKNLEIIYDGLNKGKNILIEGINIKLSEIVQKSKENEENTKPTLRGSFF